MQAIDTYPVTVRNAYHAPSWYQHLDLVEPDTDPRSPGPVLDGFKCPLCGQEFMSDDEVIGAESPESGAPMIFLHQRCMTDAVETLLEALDYDLCTETGAWMEANT